MTHRLVPAGLAGALLLNSSALSAEPVERAFAAARDYTVLIESRIETPFIEDEPGSFFGAGFVVDRERRWVLTNAHVAGKSPAHLSLAFVQGPKRRATPVYIDSSLDLAVLKVADGAPLPGGEAVLDCEATPHVGVPVGAFGHPNGFKFTGTRGIIAGVSTQFGAELLQTDAAVNHGNSGGPLINLATGRVVGINAFVYRGATEADMGLAVESLQACRLLDVLRGGADPRPPALGLLFYTVEDEPTLTVAHAFGAGERAGLQRGDRILAVDGVPLPRATESTLLDALRGKVGTATLLVETESGGAVERTLPLEPQDAILDRRGILIGGALIARTNHADAHLLYGAPKLMVHSVAPGSAAESLGLQPYDHVTRINGVAVAGLDDLARVLPASADGVVTLDILRFAQDENRFSAFVQVTVPILDPVWVAFGRPREAVTGPIAVAAAAGS